MAYLDELNSMWSMVKDSLAEEMSSTAFDLWYGSLLLLQYDSDSNLLTFEADSDFKVGVLLSKHRETLEKRFAEVVGLDVNVTFVCRQSEEKKEPVQIEPKDPSPVAPEASPAEAAAPAAESPFQDGVEIAQRGAYTFDNFIVGKSNNFAHAACWAIANHRSEAYNPLFIYGPSGLGKTHLMFAVVNELHRQYPDLRVIYTKGDDFTNYMIDCLSRKSMQEFHNKYRSCDVLLVDDIQFIAGKQAIQEEFFNTFQTLFMENKQIILASDRPPRDINPLELRLRTRFEQGLLADIQPPDLELRVAIIKKKAGSVGITLPDDVLNYLAENLRSNIRQIEGSIKKLSAKSFLSGRAISLELARDCISELLGGAEPLNTTIDKIFAAIFQKYNISKEDIVGKKRTKEIVLARHLAAYLIREITEISLPNIGKTIGGRDHTTVLSSIKVIERRMASDPLFALDIDTLKKEISSV